MKLIALGTVLALAGSAAAAPARIDNVQALQQRGAGTPAAAAAKRWAETPALQHTEDQDPTTESDNLYIAGTALASVEEYLRSALAALDKREAAIQGHGPKARDDAAKAKAVKEVLDKFAKYLQDHKGEWSGWGGSGGTGGSNGRPPW